MKQKQLKENKQIKQKEIKIHGIMIITLTQYRIILFIRELILSALLFTFHTTCVTIW